MTAELPFPVSVEIKGVTKAATFTRLTDALDAIRTSLARLPLDSDQASYLADLFSEASAARIAHQLVEFGTSAWSAGSTRSRPVGASGT
ncbi:hypothetical protein ACIG5E_13370 [Kitasatospora sp. NPDC053057]|uniref:hypothetical protein n=1 Tax=Kitasatospora sp. NPDC053057 TaxID=3364062 RepID=UPI0037CA1A18